MGAGNGDNRWKGKRPQPFLIRFAHWLNVPLLLIMAGSGLQIFSAYPALGARGALELWWLAALFGGYDGARAVHLIGLALLGLFTLVHLVMVALHPRAIIEMVTGGKRA